MLQAVGSHPSTGEEQHRGRFKAGKPRNIRKGERFEPLPQYDVLLSSPHRNYLTQANRAYIQLKPVRSKHLNVETEVKIALHEALKKYFGIAVPRPTFWIGIDKMRSEEDWKPGTMKIFAIGKKLKKCYTLCEATDRCIIDENYRNGKGTKRKEPVTRQALLHDSMEIDEEVDMMDIDFNVEDVAMSKIDRLGSNQNDRYIFPSVAQMVGSWKSSLHSLVQRSIGSFSGSFPSTFTNGAAMDSIALDVQPSKNPMLLDQIRNGLTQLDLSDKKLSDVDIAVIASSIRGSPPLRLLHLSGNAIGPEGATLLANALKTNTTLRFLNLGNNKIGAEGAIALAKALKVNKTLQVLALWNNSMGDQGVVSIAVALSKNEALQRLYVRNNRIGNAGAIAMAGALKGHAALQTLSLEVNQIGALGAAAMADALKKNSKLKLLGLYSNKIGDDGAVAFASALKENGTLKVLGLDDNGIGDIGAASMADAVKENTGLQGLGLGRNRIGNTGAVAIQNALKVSSNRTLTVLGLDDNKMDVALKTKITSWLTRRR